jgi:hypothetical protein
MTLLIVSICVVSSAIIGLLVLYAIYRKLNAPKPRDEAYWAKERAKFEKTSRKLDRKQPNPLLYALCPRYRLFVCGSVLDLLYQQLAAGRPVRTNWACL